MAPAENALTLNIDLAYSPAPGEVRESHLTMQPGATVSDALRQCGWLEVHAEITAGRLSVGVWGKLKDLSHLLRDRDRVEVYRPLKVDPKEARRQRYSSHRAKTRA